MYASSLVNLSRPSSVDTVVVNAERLGCWRREGSNVEIGGTEAEPETVAMMGDDDDEGGRVKLGPIQTSSVLGIESHDRAF